MRRAEYQPFPSSIPPWQRMERGKGLSFPSMTLAYDKDPCCSLPWRTRIGEKKGPLLWCLQLNGKEQLVTVSSEEDHQKVQTVWLVPLPQQPTPWTLNMWCQWKCANRWTWDPCSTQTFVLRMYKQLSVPAAQGCRLILLGVRGSQCSLFRLWGNLSTVSHKSNAQCHEFLKTMNQQN